jgi:TonB family protein
MLGATVLVKPLFLFFLAFIPSAILVCGAAGLLLISERGLSKSRNEFRPAMLTNTSQVSIHTKMVVHHHSLPKIAPPAITGSITLAETSSGQVQTVDAEAEVRRPNRGTATITNAADASRPFKPLSESASANRLRSLVTPKVSAKTPVRSQSAIPHGSRVWAALARHKPKAIQRGSTTVTFEIDANGGLAHARVDQSSGNVRLDKLALQTVYNSAPFPPPPEKALYTIRIDF